jgi:1-deoxy-D-xylulose-5-phosphate synthase
LPLGRGVLLREGRSGLALLAFGSLVASAERIGAEFDATVVNMRYVKPMDEALIARVAAMSPYIVTLEENVIAGGAGSAVGEVLAALGRKGALLHIGIPDRPIQHGSREDCLADAGLDLEALRAQIDTWWRPMRRQMADAAR